MGEILTAANKYLSENDDSHQLLLEEFRQLTPATRRDMMELLTLCTDWQDGYDGKSVNDIEPEAWETFKELPPRGGKASMNTREQIPACPRRGNSSLDDLVKHHDQVRRRGNEAGL